MKFVYWLALSLLTVSISLAQGQPGIDLLSRVQTNRILLRWIPTTPEAWQAANQSGYVVTRTTLTSASATPSPTKTVPINGIRSTDQAAWQPYLNADSIQYASIYYLTLNDASNFQRPPASVTDSMAGQAVVTPQFKLDERYVYVTIAANTKFAAAVKAGLGYIDTDAQPGETYRYTVSTPATVDANGTSQAITSSSVTLGLADYVPLPKPVIRQPVQQDKRRITLAWDSEINRSRYGSYDVERATNLTGTFRRLNESPHVQLADSSQYLYYPDSLPNKTRIYQYRIIGRSYFDEAQISDPVAVTVVQELQSLPGISSVRVANGQYTINWRYPLEGTNTRLDTLISQFRVSVSSQDTTGYRPVGPSLPYSVLTTSASAATLAGLIDTTRSYYFRVSAIGIAGDTTHSLPYLIVPQDKTPPATPQGVLVTDLNANATTTNTHLIRVEWRPNAESDLLGYQVFRQIGTEVEKIEVSGGIHSTLFIVDTLSRNVGLPMVTYFIWAYDQSYHRSPAAGIGRFKQPDKTGPMPPLLTGYGQATPGVTLTWELSPSSRMESVRHDLLRREAAGTSDWQIIRSAPAGDTVRRYTDTNVIVGTTYVYSMIAYDEAGNASCYKRPADTPADCYQLLLVTPGAGQRPSPITSFTVRYDTLTSQVNLAWQANQTVVQTYEIYKARAAFNPSAWKTLDGFTLSAADTEVDSGLTYVYQLRAVLADGSSTPWVPATVTIRPGGGTVTNQLPRVNQPLVPQYGVVGTPFSYTLPANAFTDSDGQLVSTLYTGNFPAGLIAQGPRLTGTPTQPGNYTLIVIATDDRNGVVQTPLVLTVEPALAPPTVYGLARICQGQSLTLTTAACSGDVHWSTGAVGPQLIVTPQQTVTYTASCQTVRQTSGLSTPFIVTVIPPLSAPLLTNQTICLDGSATLAATNCSGELRWSVGHTSAQLTVSPVVTTVYTATCAVAGCLSPAGSATVTVNSPPSLTIAGTLTPCAGQPTTLTAQSPGASTYRWSTGASTPSLTTSTNGVYAVTVTGSTGCSRSDSVAVTSLPRMIATIVGNTTLCGTTSTALTAYGGSAYAWNTGATTATISVSAVGPYSVTVSNGSGCQATTAVNVTNGPAPAPAIAVSANPVASGQSVTLTASGCAGTISWLKAGTLVGSGPLLLVTPTASSTYAAHCAQEGCTSLTATAAITVLSASISVAHFEATNGQITTNALKPYLQINNTGTGAIDYAQITLRYWLTVEGAVPITNFQTYNAQVGSNNVRVKYVSLSQPRPGATGYVEYSFDAAAGTLAGGSNSGSIQNGFSKQDYSNFDQTDDYSYVLNRDYTLNPRITAYVNGVLVYGTEPDAPGTVASPLSLSVAVSPATIQTTETTTVSATVAGGTGPYSYQFTGPGSVTPSGTTARVTGLPAGVQSLTVVVSDASQPTTQRVAATVSVTVSTPPANSVPIATANDNQTATVGVPFTYTVNTFTDAETPGSLTYSASLSPANGLSFDPASRRLSGTPTQSGQVVATISALDPGGLATSTSFTITVKPQPTPANTAPVASANTSQTATVGVAFSYTVNAFSDAETPTGLTYVASISPANGLGFETTTRVISGVPSTTGVSSVTIIATDPAGLSATSSFTITVNPAVVAAPTTLRVQHRDASNGQFNTNAIYPYLLLENTGNQAIPYNQITVRYWLTVENPAPVTNLAVYGADMGAGNVRMVYVPSVRPGATGYVEYSFTPGAGNLGALSNSGGITNAISKQDYSSFDQSDDYSYRLNRDFVLNPQITAYVNGTLVWGQEP